MKARINLNQFKIDKESLKDITAGKEGHNNNGNVTCSLPPNYTEEQLKIYLCCIGAINILCNSRGPEDNAPCQ